MWLVEATRSQLVWSSRSRNWGGNSTWAGSDWLTHRRRRQLLGIHSRMEAPSPLSPYPPPQMLRLPCRWLLNTEPPTQRTVLFANNTQREVKSLSRVWLFVTPWTIAYHAPPSMGFLLYVLGSNFNCSQRFHLIFQTHGRLVLTSSLRMQSKKHAPCFGL